MKKRFIIFLALIALGWFAPTNQSKAEELSTRLKGRILLQVESKGEAWYVNPKDIKRYYMANGSEAYKIMRNLGVGITNKDLERVKADKIFAKKHQGKIFLQVESKGEAYYIDIDGNAHYLKDGPAAYGVMRNLGLGITNNDLIKIGESKTGLKIVVKDFGMPDVRYLEPVIKEIQLKNESGQWVTIWSNSEGKTVMLTPDGVETVLDTVVAIAGTYTATRLFVGTMNVGVDVNRDGDILDKNVQTVLTLEEFNALPPKEKPSAPSAPSAPSQPSAPSAQSAQPNMSISSEPSAPSQPSAPSGGDKPEKPSQPSAPSAPSAPYEIRDGYVYLPEYQDEEHTDTINNYITPQMASNFVYDGSGGQILYDFTLHPLLPRGQHISIEVSSQVD